jgi:HPt (histidine-containing phosphotransfer) domain-containing protein
MNSDSTFDWNYLHQLSGDNEELEFDLLQTLIENLPEHIAALKEAIVQNDYQRVRSEAHYIKGSSSSVGANYLRDLTEELEQNARNEDLQDAIALLAEMEKNLDQIQLMVADKYRRLLN